MANFLKPFVINSTDIQFILDQLNFRPLFDIDGNAVINWDGTGTVYNANHAAYADLGSVDANIAAYGTSYQSVTDLAGLRDVTGLNNNLALVNNAYGAVDQIFTRSAAADYANYSPIMQAVAEYAYAAAKQYYGSYGGAAGFNSNGLLNTDYTITLDTTPGVQPGDHTATDGTAINIQNVVDYTPRMISLTTTTAGVTYDTWANHAGDPDAASHTANEIYYDASGVATVLNWGQLETVANGGLGQIDTQARLAASAGQDDHFIGGLNPGVSPSNGFFVLFGQFFDHGLDFIDKASGATIKITLAADDPLYGMTGPDGRPVHEITINRATVETIDANGPEYVNHTSPFIDQSQTYGSHEQLTTLLREWVIDPSTGQYHAGMTLFDGNTLATAWTKADGSQSHETLPTLDELRAHIEATGRDALTWEDVSNLRNRDASGHVVAGASGSALLLDMNPRFDIGHLQGFYDANKNGAQDGGEANYGTQAQADKVDAAIATLDADVKANYGPGADLHINANGVLELTGLGPQALTGASALFPWVDFSNFGIMQTHNIVNSAISVAAHAAVGEILMASVGDHYIAGDGRVNENFGLTSIHHIFHEEHNYQVQNLMDAIYREDTVSGDATHAKLHEFQINTGDGTDDQGNYINGNGQVNWDLDKMFNAAKLVVEMEYQHAAVDQYARNVTPNIQEFVGYSPDKNPAISLEYAQAAFRFGHSTLRETIDTIDPSHGLTGKIMGYALKEAFLSPEKYADIGPASVLLGMSHQQMNEVDEFVTPALNQGLLGQPLDLAAINIARGRDIGIPTLNDFRDAIGLAKYTSWNDFGQNMQHPTSLVNFIAAYAFDGDMAKAQAIIGLTDGTVAEGTTEAQGFTIDQAYGFLNGDETVGGTGTLGFNHIDTWLGGLAEIHQPGGLLGETFDKVFVTQIESLMDGDRFYYLFRLAGQQFAEEVGNGQLKDIVERNTGLAHLNGNIFGYADQYVDLGAHKEVVAPGAEALTTGNEHKYGDIAAVDDGTIGVYSNGGRGNLNDGHVVKIGGVNYIQDTRLANTDPNSAYGQNGFVNLDGTPNSGAESSEVIVGSKGNDLIYAQGGDDTVYGDGGNDTIYGGYGIDRLYGGDGNDTLRGGDNPDLMDGGSGDDVLYGESSGSDINGNDQVIGGSGNDTIYGGIGIDKLSGGTGDDKIFGDQDTDPFTHGSDGNDYVDGGSGGDILYGDNGDDVLAGGADQDQMFGGNGDDIIRPGDPTGALTIGSDEVLGGDGVDVNDKGFDLIDFSDNSLRPGGVTLDLSNQINPGTTLNGTPTQVPSFQIDGVVGSIGNDTIIGDDATAAGNGSDAAIAGNNWLIGGSGNDTFTGSGGNDVIIGGHIRLDTLIGRYESAPGVASTYDHNNNNDGSTEALRLQDARYQGASHRVGYTDTLSAGLLDNATIGTQDFAKHFTEMLRSDQFKNTVLGDGGIDGTADMVVFTGNRADYTVQSISFTDSLSNVINAFKITDHVAGRDGSDLVTGVENFKFADITLSHAQVLNEAPVITSDGGGATAAKSIAENTTAVTMVTATDFNTIVGNPLYPQTLTYSISGGADAAKFAIDASSGVLSFVNAPNFELPADAGLNNVYDVIVQVSDGIAVDTQALAVTVTNVDEAGTGSVNIASATVAGTTVTLNASSSLADPDLPSGVTPTYAWTRLTGNAVIAGANTATATITQANNAQISSFNVTGSYTDPFGPHTSTSPETAFVGTNNGNTLAGTVGADFLIGLNGSDTYTVNNAGDVVVEAAGQNSGTDTVLTSLASYTLTANVENLTFSGNGVHTGTGNTLNNTLTGGGGIDTAVFSGTLANHTVTINGNNQIVVTGINGNADGTDTLTGIEKLQFGATTVNLQIGSTANNGNTADTFTATAPPEFFFGLGGTDTVSYVNSAVGVNASLASGTATNGDRFNSIENLTGSGLADTLAGNNGNNVLNGGGGIDTAAFTGTLANHTFSVNGSNQLVVTSNADGTDTLTSIEKLTFVATTVNVQTGSDGVNDAFTATTAPEFFIGGTGTDTVTYTGSSAVVASLATGLGTGAGNNGDRYYGIENLTGGSGGDTLTGDGNANVLTGGAGSDVLNGGDGNDTFKATVGDGNDTYNGGIGTDTYDMSGTAADTTVNLTGGYAYSLETVTGTPGFPGPVFAFDVLNSIENVIGSSGNNNITGSGGVNVLRGGAGNDSINGNGGNDTIWGDAGNDTMSGGTNNDNVVFMFAPGFGNDVINTFDANPGGGGQDLLDLTNFTGLHDITAATFNTHVHFTPGAGTVVVTIDDGTGTAQLGSITVNVTSGTLDATDFRLHL